MSTTDIGCLDHFLVWMELGQRVIKRWRLDRFANKEVRYQEALKADVHSFSESINNKIHY